MTSIIKYEPPDFILTVCLWVNLHLERGDTEQLQLGHSLYHITSFQFRDDIYREPSVRFFMEFGRYYPELIVVVDEAICELCREEIDAECQSAIGVGFNFLGEEGEVA